MVFCYTVWSVFRRAPSQVLQFLHRARKQLGFWGPVRQRLILITDLLPGGIQEEEHNNFERRGEWQQWVREWELIIESFLLTGTDSSDHHLPLTTLKRSRSTRSRRCLTREVSSTMWFRSWLPHRLSSKVKVRTVVDKQLNRLGESPLHLQAGVLSRWKYILVSYFTGIIIQSWKRGKDAMHLSEAT